MHQHTIIFDKTLIIQWKRVKNLCITIILIVPIAFQIYEFPPNHLGMNASHIWEYQSGAANTTGLTPPWRVNRADLNEYVRQGQPTDFIFQDNSDEVRSTSNEFGYVLIAKLAKLIFWWQAPIEATITLQKLTLILCTGLIALSLKSRLAKVIISASVALNVENGSITTLPFYYFWAILPVTFLTLRLLNPNNLSLKIVAAPILGFITYVRMATLPTSIFVYLVDLLYSPQETKVANKYTSKNTEKSQKLYKKPKSKIIFSVVSVVVFALLSMSFINISKTYGARGGFGHTAYIGSLAWDTSCIKDSPDENNLQCMLKAVSDSNGLYGYNQLSGQELGDGTDYLTDKYYLTLLDEVKRKAALDPISFLRRALINYGWMAHVNVMPIISSFYDFVPGL